MRLISNNGIGNMVIDFYPVKFATGEIHNRLMLKVVTFCGATQSKSYINKKEVESEIDKKIREAKDLKIHRSKECHAHGQRQI